MYCAVEEFGEMEWDVVTLRAEMLATFVRASLVFEGGATLHSASRWRRTSRMELPLALSSRSQIWHILFGSFLYTARGEWLGWEPAGGNQRSENGVTPHLIPTRTLRLAGIGRTLEALCLCPTLWRSGRFLGFLFSPVSSSSALVSPCNVSPMAVTAMVFRCVTDARDENDHDL